jgi:hypothetical protein
VQLCASRKLAKRKLDLARPEGVEQRDRARHGDYAR